MKWIAASLALVGMASLAAAAQGAGLSASLTVTPSTLPGPGSISARYRCSSGTAVLSGAGQSVPLGNSSGTVSGPITQTTAVTLTCTDGAKTATDTKTVRVGEAARAGSAPATAAAPSASLSVDPISLAAPGTVTATYQCSAGTATLSGAGRAIPMENASGTVSGPIAETTLVTLTCAVGSLTATDSKTVTVANPAPVASEPVVQVGPVNPHSFSYSAPTLDMRGQPLPADRIVKYQLGLGRSPGRYTIFRDDTTLEPGGLQTTAAPVAGSLPDGQWYAAARAVAADGSSSAWTSEAPFVLKQ